MKSLILLGIGVPLIAALFLYSRRTSLPSVPARRVARADLVQWLTTNGKVEALERFEIHVSVPTQVQTVDVREGDPVRKGQLLASVNDTAARESLTRSQAQLEAARADLGTLERGGSSAELAELDAAVARAEIDKEAAEKEIASLERLVERQAAPRSELTEQQQKLRRIQAEIAALDRKRKARIGSEDRQRVQARIREAEVAVSQAQTSLRATEIRSPADGILYTSNLRPGAFYNAGELVARVGSLDKVRVVVLVDEPELGRIRTGQAVRITWDGLPGQSWHGVVERLPSQVIMAGARSVGEVLCTVDNPGRRLFPNVTVNADIKTGEADHTLTVAREAVVRENGNAFVLVVDTNGVVDRRPVKLGIQDATRVQVAEGLSEGDLVLLPGDRVLKTGEKVEVQP